MKAMVLIAVRKASTGETRVVTIDETHSLLNYIGVAQWSGDETVDDLIGSLHFELEDNNWSCDCNRCQFFDDDWQDTCRHDEYAVQWFEVGGRRFVAQDDYGLRFVESNGEVTRSHPSNTTKDE